MRNHRQEQEAVAERAVECVSARRRASIVMRGVIALSLTAAFLALGACSAKEGRSAEAQAELPAQQQQAPAQQVDWKQVDSAMGRAGKMQDDGAYKYRMPRSDLHVTVNGVAIKPALSLGSWLAMKPAASGVVAMGDLVLTEGEVTPVIRKLRDGGVMQTALHNHLLHESPRVMYLHVHGEGDPVKIAQAVHAALGATKTPAAPAGKEVPPQPLGIDTAGIDQALGRTGNASGGVYHVTVPRDETIRAAGIEVPPSMGVATAINFQPTGGGKAAINGDFVMTAGEVNNAIRALEDSGIQVIALHNHMLTEEPRLFFMHFWANDDAVKLAKGLRAALDKMAVKLNTTR